MASNEIICGHRQSFVSFIVIFNDIWHTFKTKPAILLIKKKNLELLYTVFTILFRIDTGYHLPMILLTSEKH